MYWVTVLYLLCCSALCDHFYRTKCAGNWKTKSRKNKYTNSQIVGCLLYERHYVYLLITIPITLFFLMYIDDYF